jgi:molecular chaperone DnaK
MATDTPVLGIDFGTTNTAAAWCDVAGKIHLVPTGEKTYVLPSVVWYGSKDRTLVGHPARQQIIDDPQHTIYGSKRFIGRRCNSEYVARHKDTFVYPIVEDEAGLTAVEIDGEVTPLTDVAFRILQRILELANAAAATDFDECVLTVPAHFSYGQRKAVRTSAEMLGLEVRAVVNEPTAAALYYAKHKDMSQKVLVFDLGGGTFDATLLGVNRRVVEVLGTGGDAFLGGMDFDAAIVESLCERFAVEQGVDLRSNKVVMQRLLFAAEAAKISLTKDTTARIRVPFVAQQGTSFLDLEHTLTREELETITEKLVAKSLGIVEDTLEKAGIPAEEVGEIVFVGGQTRMPALQRRLSQKFRHDPTKNIHPELGVAIGAAILGRTLNLPRGPALVDVIPIPIGVMLPGVGSREVIRVNTPVPATERLLLDQRPPTGQPLALAIYEAVDPTSVDRELLGTARVEAEWLEAHPGPLELEIRLGQDFDMTVALLAEGGESQVVEVMPPRRG